MNETQKEEDKENNQSSTEVFKRMSKASKRWKDDMAYERNTTNLYSFFRDC